MHVCCREREEGNLTDEDGINAWRQEEPVRDSFARDFGEDAGRLKRAVAIPAPG